MAKFNIYNQEDLLRIESGTASDLNEYSIQHDITLSGHFAPLENIQYITLNGNGNTIENLVNPMFISIFNSTVENLNLDVNISSSYSKLGSIANESASCQFNNNKISGKISGPGYVGGLVGLPGVTNFDNNQSCADITGVSYVGGIGGYSDSSNYYNNTTSGNISGCFFVAGIVAYTLNGIVEYNTSNSNITSRAQYSGGISAFSRESTVENNLFSGNVNGAYNTSGIVGCSMSSTITDNTFSGTVISSGAISDESICGIFIK
ncbi:MAG: hypothetical protein LBN09_06140 [Clostridioides sp.]|jgi:hypothetical protein|nr:hypothetical protein [Clostridioides sp.]